MAKQKFGHMFSKEFHYISANAVCQERTIPSAVGGDQEKRHGIILAKSIPSKKYGIQTGESVMEAKKKCPNLSYKRKSYAYTD